MTTTRQRGFYWVRFRSATLPNLWSIKYWTGERWNGGFTENGFAEIDERRIVREPREGGA